MNPSWADLKEVWVSFGLKKGPQPKLGRGGVQLGLAIKARSSCAPMSA